MRKLLQLTVFVLLCLPTVAGAGTIAKLYNFDITNISNGTNTFLDGFYVQSRPITPKSLSNGDTFNTRLGLNSNFETSPTGVSELPYSVTPNSQPLSAVPEPSTMLLLGTGIVGLAAIGMRRKI